MSQYRSMERSSSSTTPPGPDAEEGSKPPAPRRPYEGHEGHEGHEENKWTVDEEGIVDEPSDDAGPDFNADLDPTDAP
ncbi:MAG: hypothetical protein IVW55_03680 [Chloroflexi bacterium]|nr:hypothetical protein [Chloroflexota bacterium]